MDNVSYDFNKIHEVEIPSGSIQINGLLYIPKNPLGIVLFVHGSGSSRFSVRNQFVAKALQSSQLATLLFDLFTPEEESRDAITGELRFNIEFLASRLLDATKWIEKLPLTSSLSIGYFGASTGGGAAIVAAAQHPSIRAVVSRGGRPDLAGDSLSKIKSPTLLIVGGDDTVVIQLNEQAFAQLTCIKKLEIVPGATHLFEEPGTLEQVAELAKSWFLDYL